jgi:hypothetical protein
MMPSRGVRSTTSSKETIVSIIMGVRVPDF